MNLTCQVCDQELMSDEGQTLTSEKYGSNCCFKCDHAYPHYKKLFDEVDRLRRSESEMRDKILSAIKIGVPINAETVMFSKDVLDDLWAATRYDGTCSKGYKSLQDFLSGQLVEGAVTIAACDLFYTRFSGDNKHTLLQKLEELYKKLSDLYTFHGWKVEFDITPEQLVKKFRFWG
jgi:hypothetical protein